MKCEKMIVSGVVQGVGFRYFTANECLKRSLTGYAKNLSDGRVEVVVCGEESPIDEVFSQLQKGPRTAVVDNVTREPYEPSHRFDDFRIH
ncbi:MAG: acylphosphatase [Vibrio sp.]